ncbi:MAG: oligosaccharide flippase family protein [Lachnospiraceae bacterium]|nr:oligosaccharide flippase family protein [Lachnospiraceae bacterium]
MFSLMGKAAAMVLFLLADIFCARLLTEDEYGEWNFFYAIATMFFWIVGFGISASTRVYAAKAREDKRLLRQYVNSGFLLRVLVTVLFIPVLLLLRALFTGRLGYPDKYPNLMLLMLLGIVIVALNTFNELFKDLFIATVKFANMFWINIAEYGGYLVWGILGIMLIGNNTGIALGYIVALLQCVVLQWILLYKDDIQINLKKYVKKQYVTTIFHYAMPILVLSFGALVLTEMDTFMIGIFCPPSEAGTYSVAKKMLSKISHINFAICSSTMTQFVLINKENFTHKRKLYHKVVGMNLMLTIAISAGLFLLGPWGITLLYGERYAEAGMVLRALVPYYFMYGTALFFATLLDYQEKAKTRSYLYMVMVVLNLILNYVLIPRYGAVGAAAATVVAMMPYYLGLIIQAHLIFVRIQSAK